MACVIKLNDTYFTQGLKCGENKVGLGKRFKSSFLWYCCCSSCICPAPASWPGSQKIVVLQENGVERAAISRGPPAPAKWSAGAAGQSGRGPPSTGGGPPAISGEPSATGGSPPARGGGPPASGGRPSATSGGPPATGGGGGTGSGGRPSSGGRGGGGGPPAGGGGGGPPTTGGGGGRGGTP
uniref:Uncharacterized protein n=1 Tax=Amphimedon queenslandica TaxID=400682 RepID=A0A1X7UR43_AMPQE